MMMMTLLSYNGYDESVYGYDDTAMTVTTLTLRMLTVMESKAICL